MPSQPDWPILTNLSLDPFERTGIGSSIDYYNWMAYQIWRFVFVQEAAEKFAESFAEFPPLQAPASFNLDSLRAQSTKAPHPAWFVPITLGHVTIPTAAAIRDGYPDHNLVPGQAFTEAGYELTFNEYSLEIR